jgi:C-terminal processing protease CtpA/Prc
VETGVERRGPEFILFIDGEFVFFNISNVPQINIEDLFMVHLLKFPLSILIFSLLTSVTCAKNIDAFEIKKLEALCRVYGFIKYYHPTVQALKIDWDKSLLTILPKVLSSKTINNFNENIDELIRPLDEVKKLKFPYQFLPKDTSLNNLDFKWIDDTSVFSISNIKFLRNVIENYSPKRSNIFKNEFNRYYEDYGKEYFYSDSIYFPDTVSCLLNFFRYWNAVNYFFSYKKIMDKDWNEILREYIPEVVAGANSESYYWTIAKLVASLNDCHTFLDNHYIHHTLGYMQSYIIWYFSPVEVKKIDTLTVITDVAEILSNQYNINKGDVLLKVNGYPINEIRDSLKYYCGCSTEKTVDRQINEGIFNSFYVIHDSVISLTLSDSAGVKEIFYPYKRYKYKERTAFKNYESDSIGYINLSAVTKKQVRQLFKEYAKHKGIILDLRNNASYSLSGNISLRLKKKETNSKVFGLYYMANTKYPGTFIADSAVMHFLGLRLFHKKFKGKIVVLINENVQSSFEFDLMSMKHLFDITYIGSNTAGTNGATSSFLIQKNMLTYFSTDAIFYPDGRQVQRIGIVPDIYCNPSIEGIRQGRDEMIEEAVRYIK